MDATAARGLTSRFSDLRLAVKILLAVGVAALVAVIVGVVGLRALAGSTHVANDINDKLYTVRYGDTVDKYEDCLEFEF